MTLEERYHRLCKTPSDIYVHLPRLYELARGLDLVVEFGVRHAVSTTALLMGAKKVVSFDIVEQGGARELKQIVNGRWDLVIHDSRTANVPVCDMLFIDAKHTYDHVRAELKAHAEKAKKYLAFHDSVGFGSVGDGGELVYGPGNSVGRPSVMGIRPAIDELMMDDDSWRLKAHYTDCWGLLVLERR